ncbi:MAG: NAD-dependent epimerase/dehydratase family protein [Fimbriimonadaceae bacterium]|nr:NAD-dependent epimerase/dehydratase family protein [Fimbriimonadaceae bacterium]
MKILITGGAGFVGANLAQWLAARGHRVFVMDNLVRRGSELNLPRLKEQGITFVHGDVRCAEDFVALPKDIEVVLECCAQPSAIDGYANPLFDINNNTIGLLNTLEFARRCGAGLVFWSTNKTYAGVHINKFPVVEQDSRWVWDKAAIAAEYGDKLPAGFDPDHGFSAEFTVDGKDHSIYGLSKIMADLACQEWSDAFGVKTVINRFSCLAGEGQFGKSAQGWVAWWAIAFHFGLPLKYIGWAGKQVRDALFIEDICRLIETEIGMLDQLAGRVFNVGGGRDITLSLREATALMERRFGWSVPVVYEEDPRKADHCIYISDIRPLTAATGWTPQVTVEEGYDRIIRWVVDHEDELARLYLDQPAKRAVLHAAG